VDAVPVLQDLIRHGRTPGPANLLPLVEAFLKRGGSAKRDAICRHVQDAWRDAGGQPLSSNAWGSSDELAKWASRVKRTLAKLRDQGRIREVVDANGVRLHGTWEWVFPESVSPGSTATSDAELNVGSGKHLVYGLYDPRAKERALAAAEDRWLMKIGKTRSRSPYERIQDGAFLPDRLSWGIAVWTDDPDRDEKLLRDILERRGRHYEGTGGKEWFITSPSEIETLYVSLLAT
jgi:hypothetical protein